jgi:hypothetical protein
MSASEAGAADETERLFVIFCDDPVSIARSKREPFPFDDIEFTRKWKYGQFSTARFFGSIGFDFGGNRRCGSVWA